jgi:hypothetical protein
MVLNGKSQLLVPTAKKSQESASHTKQSKKGYEIRNVHNTHFQQRFGPSLRLRPNETELGGAGKFGVPKNERVTNVCIHIPVLNVGIQCSKTCGDRRA